VLPAVPRATFSPDRRFSTTWAERWGRRRRFSRASALVVGYRTRGLNVGAAGGVSRGLQPWAAGFDYVGGTSAGRGGRARAVCPAARAVCPKPHEGRCAPAPAQTSLPLTCPATRPAPAPAARPRRHLRTRYPDAEPTRPAPAPPPRTPARPAP